MKPLDLRFGNPGFLQDYWVDIALPRSHLDAAMPYRHDNGMEPLKEEIRKLHLHFKNSVPTGEVVIGHGASQILQAALFAIHRLNDSVEYVYARAPYFQRFPWFVNMCASPLTFVNAPMDHEPADKSIEIVTSPNNPDGEIITRWLRPIKHRIFDLCYNWPQFTGGPAQNFDEDIMVFSLSKATGHSSTRIGWALVKDEKIAEQMRHFIELQTSDVSIDAQVKALDVLAHQNNILKNGQWSAFDHGADIIKKRWKDLNKILAEHPDLIVKNRSGMFAWVECVKKNPTEYFRDLGVQVINGGSFGSPEQFARVNVGCSQEHFMEFINRMKVEKSTEGE